MENSWDKLENFDLDHIAAVLESLEETIIYRLLDRSQFARNRAAYWPGASSLPGLEDCSLFEARLRQQEEMDARFGRFLVPEERPFHRDLPLAQRTPPRADNRFPGYDFELVNQGEAILKCYGQLLDLLCAETDDGHYGSSVEMDVAALQAIARRVHFGSLYVGESKFRDNPKEYLALIGKRDEVGLMRLLTRPTVEARILERVREKIDQMQRTVNTKIRRVVNPETLMDFYRESVIPLTKRGEIAWLLAHREGDHESAR